MVEFEQARIRHIALYPVKSCGRLEISEAVLTPSGLETSDGILDHEFMIVKGEVDRYNFHRFITQRDFKSKADRNRRAEGFNDLVFIKPQIQNGGLELTWNGQHPIKIPKESYSRNVMVVSIWLHAGLAVEVPDYLANENPVRAQDGYPVHWFSVEDVEELSEKAEVEVPWTRFRPQIVVEGMPAQSVHQVFEGTISGVPFVDAKPCDRCQIPQIDQDTGEVTNIKPLSILKKYKRWVKNEGDTGYIFGENMLPLGTGRIAVGDELVVTSHRNPPLVYS